MYYIKKIYLYKNTHLPKDGWLQGCFKCQQITSRVYLYRKLTRKENIYEFYFYKCNSCGRELNRCSTKLNAFYDTCDDYIVSKYAHLFAS